MSTRSTKDRPRKPVLLQLAICFVLLSACVAPVSAQGSDRTIAQYVHTAWTQKQGAPTGILALAQTKDGFLWIGCVDGLYRFDGVTFELRRAGIVYALLALPNGDLWIGRKSAVSLLRDGQTTDYTVGEGVPNGKVTSFAVDGDGRLWMATNAGLAWLDGHRWTQAGRDWSFNEPFATGMLLDRQKTFWVAAGDTILYLPHGSHRFQPTGLVTSQVWKLAEAPDGKLWMTETTRSVRPIPLGRNLPPPDSTEVLVGSIGILFDRSGSLWMSTIGDGVRRVSAPERMTGRKFKEFDKAIESFTSADGLTDDLVTAILEDREGNVWVGTNGGLDRFYKSALIPVIIPFRIFQPVMVPGDAGSVWVSGSDRAFQIQRSGSVVVRPVTDQYLYGYRAPDGSLWWSGTDFIDRVMPGAADWSRARRVLAPLDPVTKSHQSLKITEDRNGTIWAASESAGVFALKNNHWQHVESVPASPGYAGKAAFTDWIGRVWLGFEDGTLVLLEEGRVKRYWPGIDGPVGPSLPSIAGRGKHVWLGGEKLVFFDGEKFHELEPAYGQRFKIWGIEETKDGSLWICENRGVIHVPSLEVQRFLGNYSYRVRFELYDSLDGLPGSFHDAAGRSREIQGTDGRLWFSSNKGIVWLDPRSISRNSLPPPVTIRSIKADGRQYPPTSVVLPPLSTAVEIDYTALSLSIPERVLFRYMLQGVDKNWEDAGTRRAAYYTSLTPGTYRFQVIACNNDGVWNQDGATLVFLVAPTWYQTLWFKSVVGITLLATCFFAYRLRVRQIAVSLGVRFDERLAERTRMARELHDTFLQTVQGSKMIVEDALQPGADTDRMRQALEKVFVWLTQAVGEGRAALHALRTSTMERNRISEALQRAAEDPQIPSSMTVSMTTVGDPHDLHPIVRDEIYRIAFEAIHNAALHSKASRLQIELHYANDISVRVSDNGIGMDPAVADRGKDGHFGLQGMRERATRIHGKLSIRSSVGSGTEVTVSVPGNIVYRTTPLGLLQRIRDRLRRLVR